MAMWRQGTPLRGCPGKAAAERCGASPRLEVLVACAATFAVNGYWLQPYNQSISIPVLNEERTSPAEDKLQALAY